MGQRAETVCPGCGLRMPPADAAGYGGYYHASKECWSVYTEVLGREFGDAPLFGRVHQLTVDAYAVQHAGGPHPDKSVDVHLCGLHLVLERGEPPTGVPRALQRLVAVTREWPHFPPPAAAGRAGELTVLDVALAETSGDHAERSRAWAESVWRSWSAHHAAVARFVERSLARA